MNIQSEKLPQGIHQLPVGMYHIVMKFGEGHRQTAIVDVATHPTLEQIRVARLFINGKDMTESRFDYGLWTIYEHTPIVVSKEILQAMVAHLKA